MVRRLTDVLDKTGKTYEIILANDCGPDNSWQKIAELCKIHSEVKGISLRRNCGSEDRYDWLF